MPSNIARCKLGPKRAARRRSCHLYLPDGSLYPIGIQEYSTDAASQRSRVATVGEVLPNGAIIELMRDGSESPGWSLLWGEGATASVGHIRVERPSLWVDSTK